MNWKWEFAKYVLFAIIIFAVVFVGGVLLANWYFSDCPASCPTCLSGCLG